MSENNRTLKINPDLFKMNGKIRNEKKNKSLKNKPILDEENSSKTNKIKKEMMKKVKDFQRNKEKEQIKDEKKQQPDNLFEKNTYENSDFEREFNTSLNFLQDLAKKNKEKKKNNRTVKNTIPNVEINLNLPDNLDIPHKIEEKNINSSLNSSYGCLKNGNKPTFKQLNKTQKNNDDFKQKVKIVLENNVFDDDIKPDIKADVEPVINPIIEPLKENKPGLVEEINNKIEDLNDIIPMKKIKNELLENEKKNEILKLSTKSLMDNNEFDKIIKNEEDDIKLKEIPKIKKVTRKSTYKIGKLKDKNSVGILIKNRDTQKNIKREVSLLKQKSIQDIKNHLRSKNLIKVGSDAPNDVLRKMYEDSILLGELENNNNSYALYNYLNE